jgi:tyrosine-protein kinase Etk/Wzc
MDTPNPAPDFNFAEEESLTLKRWLSLVISNWYWFVFALLIAVSAAYLVNRYSRKIYTVSSTILIKDDRFGVNPANIMPGAPMFRSQTNLNNEIGIIKSFSLNHRVMKELSDFHVVYVEIGRRGVMEAILYNTSPFKVIYNSIDNEPKGVKVNLNILSEKKYRLSIDGNNKFVSEMNFGERFNKFGFDFTIEPRDPIKPVYLEKKSNSYYFYFVDPGTLASEYMNKLSTSQMNANSSIVTLSVSGPVLAQEADYLNKLMDVYIQWGLDIKNQTADSTIKFIERQLRILSDSLKKSESNLQSFQTETGYIDLSNKGTLIQNRIEEAEKEKTTLEMQLKYYNYLSDYLNIKNAPGNIMSPSLMGISDPLLLAHINNLADLQKQISSMSLNIGSDQPAFLLLSKQMDAAREALGESVSNNISNLKKLLSESDKKVKSIEVEINKLPELDRRLINIKRRVDLNNTIYTFLLEKSSESSIAKATNVPDNWIIDRASFYSSSLIRPKPSRNLYFAIVIGLMIPLVLIVMIEVFNDKVKDKKDIELKTKIPIIGYIGHSDSTDPIHVVKKPGSTIAESFRSIRTSLKYYVKEDETAVFAVSSAVSSEGKTFFSVNLAAIMAMLGRKVLLIGLDLRKPRIDRIFVSDDGIGMSTYLSGNNRYEDIIRETGIENLYYVSAGSRPPNPAELIESERMKTFIERARHEYNYIIIDTPPVGIVTDALLIASHVDVNIFIVRQRYTSRNSLEIMEQLRIQGEIKNPAIVINDISLSGYYGYGMRYNYSHGYGYYYGHSYYGNRYYGKYGYGFRKRSKEGMKGYYTDD